MQKEQISKIIDLIKGRQEEGLSLLYDSYASAVYGIIIRIVGSAGLAEEVMQQTFLKAWNRIDQFDGSRATLFTWLAAIARNTAIDKRRLKSFERDSKTESFDINVHKHETTENQLSGLDIQTLLQGLDPKYIEVLDIVYLQGYTHSEAAEVLNLPKGTVKTRLRGALMALRTVLKKEKKLFLGIFITLGIIMILVLL